MSHVWQLPIFKGYTVDLRLHQFRKLALGADPEFIDFDSVRGVALFAEWVDQEPAQFVATVEHYIDAGVLLKFEWLFIARLIKAERVGSPDPAGDNG
jgi:hypothetical protein